MQSIVKYLGDQPNMKVLRSLLLNDEGVHLRQLAAWYQLSPAGVSDILKRFWKLGILKKKLVKNKKCYFLSIPASESSVLKAFFSEYECCLIKEARQVHSRGAVEKLDWMDEAYSLYKGLKTSKVT